MKPQDFVKDYCIKSLVCCFSGGKDSLVMTHYVMSELAAFDIDKYVVYADTGCMLPITEPYVKDVCARFGWPLTIVQGNFFEHVQVNGMPRMRHRWCCWICKIKPMSEFVHNLRPQRAELVGIRKDESFKRSKIDREVYYLKKGLVWKYAPLLEWTEKDVQRYIANRNLPMPPHYRLGLKETCMCGVFSSKKQMLILKANYPDLWNRFIEAERNFKKGGAAFYFRNKPVYAKDLAKQTTIA